LSKEYLMTELTTDKLQQIVIDAMDDLKAEKINHINLEGISGFTDRMIFASGNSNRHVKSIAQSVVEASKKANVPPLGVEGEDIGDWVLVDLGDIVVHVMLPETREFYDIERLWTDQAGHDIDSE
jgi:ribosome-associated protein